LVTTLTTRLGHVLLTAGLLLAPAAVARAQAPVRVSLVANRTELPLGESVVVQISVQSQSASQAEVELPEFEGFDVTRRGVERPMQFSFGFGQQPVVTSTTTYTFVLVATVAGRHRIGPVRATLDGKAYQSDALTLTVQGQGTAQAPTQAAQPQAPGQPQAPQAAPQSQPDPAPQAAGDAAVFDNDAFLRTVVDKTEPYEGEQVTVTLYLYIRRNLQQAPAVLTEPTTDGFWTRDLINPSAPPQPSRQAVNGRAFWVYVLRRFAAFPLKSGELTIGSMALNISRESIFDIFNPAAAPADLQRKSVPLLVRVKPLPAEGRSAGDVAVGNFELSAQLDRNQAATGDAVTLTATVRGVGHISAVRVASPVVDQVDVLQPETRELVESPNDLVQGTRTLAWLLVPKAPGTHTIPPLVLETFDPASGAYRRATTAALTLTAAGNAQPTPATESPTTGTDAAQGEAVGEHVWPPPRATSELLRHRAALADHPAYPWALLVAPLLWMFSVTVPWLRARIRARAEGDTTRVALQMAETRLTNARQALDAKDDKRFFVEIAHVINALLQARCGQAVTGLTRPQLRALLDELGVASQPAREALDVLERCDVARFSPAAGQDDDLRSVLTRVERLLGLLGDDASAKPREVAS
jgi:BatD DUF11 like domain